VGEVNKQGIEMTEFTPYSDFKPVEVILKSPADFLCIVETLTRIGVASRDGKTIYQSCHILHKRGRYALVHYKEMFRMDGKIDTIEKSDIERRNRIAMLLNEWGLLEVIDTSISELMAPMANIRIVSHKDKEKYTLTPKYKMGVKR
jgi:hypothetical protein